MLGPHEAGVVTDEEYYDRLLPFLYLEGSIRALLDEARTFRVYDQPELMLRINTDLADFHVRTHETLSAVILPNMIGYGEDMSYNLGPMLSKELFEGFLLPVMQSGDFVPSVDHQTPQGVSLEECRVYLRLFMEYAEVAAREM